MGKLVDLLRYKTSVILVDERTGKKLEEVWVRLIGDEDLRESFKYARIASSAKRKILQDSESVDARDDLAQLMEQGREELIEIIVAARENNISNEATVRVDREDLPEIEDIAKIPDAPTLLEQERLDERIEEVEKDYEEQVADYIKTKSNEVRASLKDQDFDSLVKTAAAELINIQALQAFIDELNDQKIFRGTYTDKLCKVKGFDSMEEVKQTNLSIKAQLIQAYTGLEMSGEELKK